MVGLQFFSPADVLTHPLWHWAWDLINQGQELYWHESYFKKGKTIVLHTKWDWSKSVMKYGIKSASEWASAHCRPACAIHSSQSNNQSKNCVSGVCAINVSRAWAKTLLRIVKLFYLNLTFSSWIQNRKMESKFRKNQEVINHFKLLQCSFG